MCRLPNRTIQSVYDGFDFDVNTVNPDNFAAFGCPEVDELPLSYFSPGVSNSDGMNSDESMRLGGLEMPVDSRATVGGKFDDVKQEPGSDRIFGVMNDLASMPASADLDFVDIFPNSVSASTLPFQLSGGYDSLGLMGGSDSLSALLQQQKEQTYLMQQQTAVGVPAARINQLGPSGQFQGYAGVNLPLLAQLQQAAGLNSMSGQVQHTTTGKPSKPVNEIDAQTERVKKRRRESAQRSRARKNTYMKSLEAENRALKAELIRMKRLLGGNPKGSPPESEMADSLLDICLEQSQHSSGSCGSQ